MSGQPVRNIQQIKSNKKTTKFSVIIPAASEGNRMRSFGSRSLLDINNQTLLEYQNNIIKDQYPNSDVIVITGFDSDRVMNKAPKGIIKIENERYKETNVLRSIGIGLRAAVHDHVLIVYGDLVFNNETFNFPIDHSCILYDKSSLMGHSQVGCTINNNELENMFYNIGQPWAQIIYLTGKELKLFRTIAFDKNKEKCFGFEACNEVVTKGGSFLCHSPKGMKIADIDSSKDLERIAKVTC